MSLPFRDARQHLDAEIVVAEKLFERQIEAHWALGILPRPKDEFSGTYVSGGEIRALLRRDGNLAEADQQRIAAIDKAIASQRSFIEEKLEASRDAGTPMPFDRIRQSFGLTQTEQQVLLLLVAIETAPHLRQLARYLANEANRIHADIGLLGTLIYSAAATKGRLIRELSPDSLLFRVRLIEPIGHRKQLEDAPFLLRAVKANRRVLELFHGVDRLDREVAEFAHLVSAPPSGAALLGLQPLVHQVTELLRGSAEPGRGVRPAVVLAGTEGAGRRSLIYAAAHNLGLNVLAIDATELPRDPLELGKVGRAILREAMLHRALPLLLGIDALSGDADLGRPDRARQLDREVLSGYAGPLAATAARTDSRPVSLERGLVMVEVPIPGETDRASLWARALGDAASTVDVSRAAARYPISGGLIGRASTSALARAQARGDALDDRDLHAGLRSTLDVKLSTLGVRIAWRQTWDDLVLPDDSIEEVREFIARVRHRRQVYDEWGFARKVAKGLGLSALFSGPPGTGKTMVAGIIADELALDLYQIDLSRIVSKYVGETEKNLASLFDAAEAGHAILLFDEADSLFAKRTEVKSSVDRYANLEVNYLLQRMEAFNGITILTTNLDSSIDEAFRRRISFRVDFPMPEPEDRRRLWRTMLPAEAQVGDDLDFELLAQRYEMTGGYIRNAVLRAAFLAAEDEQSICMSHLVRAANLEYTAMGKVIAHGGLR